MPMRSRSQWGYMFAAEQRGELAPGTASRWAHKTKVPYRRLPARLNGFGADLVGQPGFLCTPVGNAAILGGLGLVRKQSTLVTAALAALGYFLRPLGMVMPSACGVAAVVTTPPADNAAWCVQQGGVWDGSTCNWPSTA